ncbi:metal ABC transporter substrate-binding protein [Companilactobacillus allii]|uniref:Metal ABC transporter substrate-binding protein n=1 Tax=Companilactobacillus allii TaxID=1847728 RepID=A0A1P8Q1G2_9LACO|nr:metal ABC transporter substrate-binding protein [Companilactobacillus allii]APX71700.1 metal ABC transporter substrate-binding protein [Companilactobacillus allii]USQ68788.1 metal ABC transporter substrate-binding protein [Companilactobacillus allii]
MKRILTSVIAAIAIVGGVFLFLNNRATTTVEADNDKLQIVTTNSILEDMVKNVGGNRVEIHSIVKRGTDPHEYEPQPTDVAKSVDADVIFHNGLNLETGGNGWFTKLVKTSNKNFDKDVFAASDGIKPQHLTTNENEVDPHAWLDLKNGIIYVKNITKVLKDKDPRNAEYYQQNSDQYITKLTKLHKEAKAKFSNVPENQRLLVTSEGAFKYFSEAYKLKPAYIWEINTEAQGTPEQMEKLLSIINKSDVRSLFVETSVSAKSMNKVSKETGLPIYSKLFTDSLASEGSEGDTYYTMMKWNFDKIYEGLIN